MKKLFGVLLSVVLALVPVLGTAQAEPGAAALTEEARAVAGELLKGNFDAVYARLSESTRAQMTVDLLEQGWTSTTGALGAYVEEFDASAEAQGEYLLVKLTERFEEGGLLISLYYAADGSFVGLNLGFADVSAAEADPNADRYTEAELTLAGDADYPLKAVLCLPNGVEKPPVVVLVHGSGASDYNETIYANRPFQDIARGLAQRGIATLRYDKRYFTYPKRAQELGSAVTLRDETIDDAEAAVALLRADERVDGERIYVLGHSLGGMLAPVIAAETPELAGVISMSGSLRTFWEIIYDQNMANVDALDRSTLSSDQLAAIDQQLAQLEADYATLNGDFSALDNDTVLMGVPAGYWKSAKEYCGMNFVDSLNERDLPVLVLQGSADFQVYADKDYPLWQEALADDAHAEFHLYDGLNHLLMPAQGKRDLSEYYVAAHVSEEALDDIAAFIG